MSIINNHLARDSILFSRQTQKRQKRRQTTGTERVKRQVQEDAVLHV